MDALTYTLAFSRMAPVQCVTWGHPDTTGSPAIDYFISSENMETAESDAHYTEQVVRLPHLGTYYMRPKLSGPPRSREFFGIAPDCHLYICPQTLFKFHPYMDAMLVGIFERDPEAIIVLLEGRVPNWTARLKKRFVRTLGTHATRMRFLPPQPNADFLQLMSLADVMLDPFPFGGGNTSYEAFALGTPIVTWPNEFARGRITLAQYRKMGWDDCVVTSCEDYVDLAVRLAIDRDYNESIRAKIWGSNHVLYEDPEEVRALEVFLREAVKYESISPFSSY
jgi:predicted O-linked N-acetylglucosamine transferase (SPINDLY family)